MKQMISFLNEFKVFPGLNMDFTRLSRPQHEVLANLRNLLHMVSRGAYSRNSGNPLHSVCNNLKLVTHESGVRIRRVIKIAMVFLLRRFER